MKFRLATFAFASSLTFMACGDDDKPTTTDDTTDPSGSDGSDTGGSDSDLGSDTTPEPELPTLPEDVTCTRTGFTPVAETFNSKGGRGVYVGKDAERNQITLEFYYSGSLDGASGPGIYELDDGNYATCTNCVIARMNCAESGRCQKTYVADVGTLNIKEWGQNGGNFTASLHGIVARQASISAGTYQTTFHENGETWCLDNVQLSAPVKALPISDRTQPECVADGTGYFLYDNVKDVTWTNCNGDLVRLHDDCGNTEKKALWLMGTAGWCTACTAIIADLRTTLGGSISRAKVAEKNPGLDMLFILAENNSGNRPSQAFCKTYAESRGIDPAMVVMDWTDSSTNVQLADPMEYAIPTNALGSTWSVINPYLTADEDGGVMMAYPWNAVLRPYNMEYYWSDNASASTLDDAINELLSK